MIAVLFEHGKTVMIDGGLGTMLHACGLAQGERPEHWNLSHPDVLLAIHRAYLDAGAQVISANTFGANRLNFPGDLSEVISAGVSNAKEAIGSNEALVALDVGPTGKLLEPLGDFPFEDAIALFREVGELGAAAGADLFFIETMTDLQELRAAIIGLKEAAGLPIFASFSIEASGRLLTGSPVAAAAVALEGLGVAALGINCGAGPERIAQALPELRAATSLPIIAQPNAGLPVVRDGHTSFDLSPEGFAQGQQELLRMGASILGGCCGTTPAHIQALAERVGGCAGGAATCRMGNEMIFGSRDVAVLPIEIAQANPGNWSNWDCILDAILDQADAGAQAVRLNIDGIGNISGAIAYIQQEAWLPLCFASANAAKLEAALRVYTGKALVEFTGDKNIQPLLSKYGGELA